MLRRLPRTTSFYPLFPYTTLFRSAYFAQILFFYYIQKRVPKIVVDMGFDASQAGGVLVAANVGNLAGAVIIGLASQRFNLRPLVAGAMLAGFVAIGLFGVAGADLTRLSITVAVAAFFINAGRSEEHTSELQSLMRISYAVFCLKKNKQ